MNLEHFAKHSDEKCGNRSEAYEKLKTIIGNRLINEILLEFPLFFFLQILYRAFFFRWFVLQKIKPNKKNPKTL